jgi:hypothetical protein
MRTTPWYSSPLGERAPPLHQALIPLPPVREPAPLYILKIARFCNTEISLAFKDNA